MAELKAKNKELEKFKFVLDYKLRELKKEIEPRDEQIMQMRETIRELDEELQHDHRSNVGLEQSLAEKQAKIESVQNECKRIRRQVCRAPRSQA
jgi:DNA repair exonuclease SbcCD ATPase subunit